MAPIKLVSHPGLWSHAYDKDVGHLYHFLIAQRDKAPYAKRDATALIEISDDGTLAGVALLDGPLPPPPKLIQPDPATDLRGTIWRHLKRGTTYLVLEDRALLSVATDAQGFVTHVVYLCLNTKVVWIRERAEFLDGRFERVEDNIKQEEPT